jgi:opacity protein-like surface antigen
MYKIIMIILLVFVHSYAGEYYGSIKASYTSIANSKISKSGEKKEIEALYEPEFGISTILVGKFHGRYSFEAEYTQKKLSQSELIWSENQDKYTARDMDESNSLETQTLYANIYYYPKYQLYGALPYIGGGIGVANIKIVAVYDYGAYDENTEQTTMAGHITGGFIKKLDRDIYIGAGARVAQYMSVKYTNSQGDKITYEPGLLGSFFADVRILF